MGLEYEFQILCRFDVFVHILKEFLWGYTGIYLSGSYISVSQHFADGLYRDTVFECPLIPTFILMLVKHHFRA